jgi:hypothetical protein
MEKRYKASKAASRPDSVSDQRPDSVPDLSASNHPHPDLSASNTLRHPTLSGSANTDRSFRCPSPAWDDIMRHRGWSAAQPVERRNPLAQIPQGRHHDNVTPAGFGGGVGHVIRKLRYASIRLCIISPLRGFRRPDSVPDPSASNTLRHTTLSGSANTDRSIHCPTLLILN